MDEDQLVNTLALKSKKKGVVYLKIQNGNDSISVVTVRADLIIKKNQF